MAFLAGKEGEKYKILIADDSEMNRSILADILENEYEILEALNPLIIQKIRAILI